MVNMCIHCDCGITGQEVKIAPYRYAHETCQKEYKRQKNQ